jgi:hypothetical protein
MEILRSLTQNQTRIRCYSPLVMSRLRGLVTEIRVQTGLLPVISLLVYAQSARPRELAAGTQSLLNALTLPAMAQQMTCKSVFHGSDHLPEQILSVRYRNHLFLLLIRINGWLLRTPQNSYARKLGENCGRPTK